MVEPPRMKAMHLTNTLHLLGHELHADLTDDLARREAARRFEDLLRAPLTRGKNPPMPLFPAPTDLAAQCGACAVQTVKKPIRKIRGRRRLKPKKSSSVLSIEKKTSQIKIETTNEMNEEMNGLMSPGNRNGNFRLKKMAKQLADSGESVILTETSRHLPCGFQHEIQVHRHTTGKARKKRKVEKVGSECNLKTAKEPGAPLELDVEVPETPKTRLERKPEASSSKPPRNLEMYAPAELHCAADSAGRAIHNALKAMNKLILLAPKDSVDRGFLKSIALMCAFLRQFYLELKSRRDRKSKLEVILRLWQQLQQQGSPSMPLATPPAEPVDGKNNAKEKVDKK